MRGQIFIVSGSQLTRHHGEVSFCLKSFRLSAGSNFVVGVSVLRILPVSKYASGVKKCFQLDSPCLYLSLSFDLCFIVSWPSISLDVLCDSDSSPSFLPPDHGALAPVSCLQASLNGQAQPPHKLAAAFLVETLQGNNRWQPSASRASQCNPAKWGSLCHTV